MSLFDKLRRKPQVPQRPSEELVKVIAQIERITKKKWEIKPEYSNAVTFTGAPSMDILGYTLAGETHDGITVVISYWYGHARKGKVKGKEDGSCWVMVATGVYDKSFYGEKGGDIWGKADPDPASVAYV